MIGGEPSYLVYLVNAHQSAEERRMKYEYLRLSGASSGLSRRARDWNWCKVDGLVATLLVSPFCRPGYWRRDPARGGRPVLHSSSQDAE